MNASNMLNYGSMRWPKILYYLDDVLHMENEYYVETDNIKNTVCRLNRLLVKKI